MKTVVVIPTYDEKDNVKPMSEAVLKHDGVELLFVDDNSPDGTGSVIEGLMKSEPRIHCLHRTKKEGLGRAYVAGFQEAIRLGADKVIQMDCDFSHDPNDIPRLIAADADLVIGSRYVKGGATPGWPFKRRLISRLGGIFIRTVTGMPVRDPTGGFKCWKRATLEGLDLATVQSAGYSFQLEMNHRTWKRGYAIREIPITFTDRVAGYSKITPGIAVESVKIALKLRRLALVGLLLSAGSLQAAFDRPHIREIAGSVLSPDEGFLIGNGDLSCSVYQEKDAIVFRLGKGDVWDRRVDDTGCMRPVTLREFTDGVLRDGWAVSGWDAQGVTGKGELTDKRRRDEIFHGKTPRKNVGPRPKPTGEFRLFTSADLPPPQVRQRLFIEEGRIEVELRWPNGVSLFSEAVVDPHDNVLAVKWRVDGWNDLTKTGASWTKTGPVWCGVMRWADPDWREWAEAEAARNPNMQPPMFPHNTLPPLPVPTVVTVGGVMAVEQRFQPDEDYPQGFACRLFLRGNGTMEKTEGAKAAWVRCLPAKTALEGEASVAVCTTRDGNLERLPPVRAYAEHQRAAQAAARAFWAKSALAVPGDPFLEDAWYATWHIRRSVLKGGTAVPPGLFLPSVLDDFPRWNGDYHGNYNMQSIFWGEMAADRLEEAEAYFQIIDFARPLGEKIAREYYGCRGCFIQLENFAVHTLKDPHGTLPLGRMAYMTGWAMTKYWEYYRYTLDREWLKAKGYPFIRDCALFYLDFLKKAPHPDLPPELNDGKYHAFPSVQGESGWKTPMDLCDRPQVLDHARWCLHAAVLAARELRVDADLQAAWQDRFVNLVGTKSRPDQFGDCGFSREYQLHCWNAMLPEFGVGMPWRTPEKAADGWKPGEDYHYYPGINYLTKIRAVRYFNGFHPNRDYARYRDTLKHWMHPNGLVTAMAAIQWGRAGWTESFSCVAPFQEMLLQSWDGAIRLFPCWKRDIDVSFRDFRAEGAFLVSAAMTGGKIGGVRIRSLKGACCRLHGNWRVSDASGKPVTVDRDEFTRPCFQTKAGETYALEAL